MAMLETFIIFVVGLIPPLLSLWLMRSAEVRAQERLRAAIEATSRRSVALLPPEGQYIEGVGHMIGDITCRFNARSTYLRCAVNPTGPCQACPHYDSIQFS